MTVPVEEYITREAEIGSVGEVFYALGKAYIKGRRDLFRVQANLHADDVTAEIGVEVGVVPKILPDTFTSTVIGLRQFWDAAYPGGVVVNTEGVAGYIGGGTPHVWTSQEWADAMARTTAQFKLPIFTRVPPTTRDPVAEANFCADWAEAHGQPHGTLIALDYETSTVQSYLAAFDRQIVARGYRCVVYGSRSTVMTLPAPSGGRWSATWNNTPHIDSGAVMTQYGGDSTLGSNYDANVTLDTPKFWYPGGTNMPILDQTDITNVAKAVGAMFRISPDSPMTIVQYGQANNVQAFTILATKLVSLKEQITALAQIVTGEGDQTQARLDALKLEADETQAAIDRLAAAVQGGGLSAQEVADLIMASLGPEMAQDVANVIFHRMEA